MGDLEMLALVAVALYALECLVFVSRGSIVVSRRMRRWTVKQPGSLLANSRGGFRASGLLPVYPASFLTGLPPVSLSTEGVASWTALSLDVSWRAFQQGRVVRWEEIRTSTVDGRTLRINGEVFLTARSSNEALMWRDVIRRIQSTPAEDRSASIKEWMEESLDRSAVRRRLDEVSEATRGFTPACQALFAYVFLVGPVLIGGWGIGKVGWGLLAGLYLQTIVLSILAARIHRRLYPEDGDDRFVKVLTIALAPLSAIRAPDALGRAALSRFHPLAVAELMCPRPEFRELAGHLVRDLRHPMLPEHPAGNELLAATDRAAREQWAGAVGRFLKGSDFDMETAVRTPVAEEASIRSYCPRCLAQFTDPGANCSDCGGRKAVLMADR